jgi:hypothetical protein
MWGAAIDKATAQLKLILKGVRAHLPNGRSVNGVRQIAKILKYKTADEIKSASSKMRDFSKLISRVNEQDFITKCYEIIKAENVDALEIIKLWKINILLSSLFSSFR